MMEHRTPQPTIFGEQGPRLNGVLIQDSKGSRWLYFSKPQAIITTTDLGEVRQKLEEIDQLVNNRGMYAAGFITYEASPAFDSALVVRQPLAFPLLWFGIYQKPQEVTFNGAGSNYKLGPWQPSVTKSQYKAAIHRIKDLIALGRTYQVNYTLRLRAQFSGSSWSFFQDLIQAQQSSYAAYLDIGPFVICSTSPELFFSLEDEDLIAKPMKGTAPRGLTLQEDVKLADWLQRSEKNRAENVMIVDMIRNDIGRVGEIGSVHVSKLFQVEKYPTLHQMTSTVEGKVRASLPEIMTALFPCASITGAPKVSTMEIIAELEPDPRGVYTGCIGYLAPNRKAQFNVAIRTVVVDKQRNVAEYGVGGGIVWGSNVDGEYEECETKAQILTKRRPGFDLLESMLWTPEEGYFLLEEHLVRLRDSAIYFDFDFNRVDVENQLKKFAFLLDPTSHKIRLILQRDGDIELQSEHVGELSPAKVILSNYPIDKEDVYLYHKTTYREVYERAMSLHRGYDDVLLWNREGEITETTTANVVFQLGGELITPHISSGLLAGTFRKYLLDQKIIREEILTLKDLDNIQEFYLINSVRKWRDASLTKPAIESAHRDLQPQSQP